MRELRNNLSHVLRRVEQGERVTVTVDRRPVAELVPLAPRRSVPATVAQDIARRFRADPGLADDLRLIFAETTDDL